MSEKLRSNNAQEIEREVKGNVIEDIVINDDEVVIKFTNGNFIDIELDKEKQEIITKLNWY